MLYSTGCRSFAILWNWEPKLCIYFWYREPKLYLFIYFFFFVQGAEALYLFLVQGAEALYLFLVHKMAKQGAEVLLISLWGAEVPLSF